MKRSLSPFFAHFTTAVIFVVLFSCATIAFAAGADDIQGYLALFLQFINNILLPFLFSLALLFFLINVARYFIFKGASDTDREKARTLALYGIGAFVFLVSLWGIVNMFVSGLGIANERAMCPDYLDEWCDTSTRFSPGDNSFYLDIPSQFD